MNFDFNISLYEALIYFHVIVLLLASSITIVKRRWKACRNMILKPNGYRKALNVLYISRNIFGPALALSITFTLVLINYVSPLSNSYDIIEWDNEVPALYEMEILPPRSSLFKEKLVKLPKSKVFKIDPVIEVPETVAKPVLVETEIYSEDVEVVVSPTIKKKIPVDIPEPQPIKEDEPEIYVRSEVMPVFPGCDIVEASNKEQEACSQKSMLEYIYGNLKYPAIARENGLEGMVFVQFIVNIDGTVSEVQLLRDPGGGLGEEALKVVEKMKEIGLWTPGIQQGRKVNVKYTLPIKFKLQ